MIEKKIRLTKEGKQYLAKGLPEKNLMALIAASKSKSIDISDAENKVDNLQIALKWAMQKGWAKKEGSRIIFVKAPDTKREDSALMDVEAGVPVDAEMRKLLIDRKLAEEYSASTEKLKAEVAGAEIDRLTPEIIGTGAWRAARFKPYDINASGKKEHPGKVHPYRQAMDEFRQKLVGMGFQEVRGPLVEMDFWDMDALFMPSNHPARGIHDIFMLENPKEGKVLDKELWKRVEETHKSGWQTGSKGWGAWDAALAKKLMMRSQGTAVSARTLYGLKKSDIPYKMFMIGKCFRPDVIDSKHFIEFEQCEGIVVGEGLSLSNLLWYLKKVAMSFGAEDVKFKPHYFPFTEPSVEGYIKHPKWGWVEALAAGVFRPEVTLPLGIDVPVIAWGPGFGRLAALRLGLDDIRQFYSTSLKWLRDAPSLR
jgi:phenylalanyl-tRNA synthetase alpha chain